MRLYIARHGHAVRKEEHPDRPLSDRGRDEIRRMAAFMADAGERAHAVLHSGKARAQETAGIYAKSIAGGLEPVQVQGLKPNDDPALMAAHAHRLSKDTLIAGHLPHLGRLAALLVAGKDGLPLVELSTGAVVCLERPRDADGWHIEWVMQPSLLG